MEGELELAGNGALRTRKQNTLRDRRQAIKEVLGALSPARADLRSNGPSHSIDEVHDHGGFVLVDDGRKDATGDPTVMWSMTS